jgi:hypothetical protein
MTSRAILKNNSFIFLWHIIAELVKRNRECERRDAGRMYYKKEILKKQLCFSRALHSCGILDLMCRPHNKCQECVDICRLPFLTVFDLSLIMTS